MDFFLNLDFFCLKILSMRLDNYLQRLEVHPSSWFAIHISFIRFKPWPSCIDFLTLLDWFNSLLLVSFFCLQKSCSICNIGLLSKCFKYIYFVQVHFCLPHIPSLVTLNLFAKFCSKLEYVLFEMACSTILRFREWINNLSL